MDDSRISETNSDGVQRFPSNGLKIIIIGAGVGGLSAALECWRKGFEVVVLERADKLSVLGRLTLKLVTSKWKSLTYIGDFFTIPPSGLTTLQYYPSMWADYHKCVYNCTVQVYTPSGQLVTSQYPEWKRPGAIHSAPGVDVSFIMRRTVFVQMQLDQLARLNVPVHWGQHVTNVQESAERVVVKTAAGGEYVGDVCIAANGINSTLDGFRTAGDVEVQDSGYAIARVCFPRNTIKAESPAASLLKDVETHPQFRTYLANDVHLILFLTKDWVAWAFTHKVSHVTL